jgi:hypothetical protein
LQNRRLIVVVNEGGDGADSVKRRSKKASGKMFHSGFVVLAVYSVPNDVFQDDLPCINPQHPVIGNCDECGMIVHWLNSSPNSFFQFNCTCLSFNCDENKRTDRLVLLAPVIAQRKEIQRRGGVFVNSVRVVVQWEDGLKDLKRFLADRAYRLSVSTSGCPFGCSCRSGPHQGSRANVHTYKPARGLFEVPNRQQRAVLMQRGHIAREGGASLRQIGDISYGLSVAPFAGNEAVEMNHSANAVHFDGLHARIALALTMLWGLTLESQRTVQNDFKGPRREWSRDTKKKFKAAVKEVKNKFSDVFGLHIGLLMIEGGLSRLLCNEKKRDKLLKAFVPKLERRNAVRKCLEQHSLVVSVLSASRPEDVEGVSSIDTIKAEITVPFGDTLATLWPQLDWGVYVHEVVEHTQHQIEMYGSVGSMSTESSEKLNQIMKKILNAQARHNGPEACVDVLWVALLRSDPRIAAMYRNE